MLGPHFEEVCRNWVADYATDDVFGGHITRVGSGTVNDPAAKTTHDIDIAVFGELPDGREALLSIGEVKWNDTMGTGHLDRLRRIKDLLAPRFDTSHTLLACYSAAGFMPALHEAATAGETVLIGLDDLYRD
ncbi:hypothetical protein [Nocardia sp. R6R-6]|uniref:hypothetical protein n=1 Tax=Nocardia sp. R6R-6 TaxID=3459303 RepID=UPI00403E08FC